MIMPFRVDGPLVLRVGIIATIYVCFSNSVFSTTFCWSILSTVTLIVSDEASFVNGSEYLHPRWASLLGYSEWERATLWGNTSSLPPNQTATIELPPTCRIGTIAAYGNLIPSTAGVSCARPSAYEHVEAHVRSLFASTDEKGSSYCDVCRILDRLLLHPPVVGNSAPRNATITFLGDSVTNQAFGGFVCEFARRGYSLLQDELKPTSCRRMGCVQSVRRVEIGIPQPRATGEGVQAELYPQRLILRNLFQYKLPIPRGQAEFSETLADIFSNASGITNQVLVVNFGLHYWLSHKELYSDALKRLLNDFKKYAVPYHSTPNNSPLLVFRETSMQHWNASGGEYRSRQGGACVPSRNPHEDDNFGWRERILRDMAHELDYTLLYANISSSIHSRSSSPPPGVSKKELTILPFTNFSSIFDDLHPNECTHYCYTPFFWAPLWRSLRYAIERRYSAY